MNMKLNLDQLAEEERIDKEKEILKKEFGELYYKIMDILYRNDPIGISVDTNRDEYEHEVIEILPRLKEINSPDSLTDLIYQFFINEFGPIITGKRTKYIKIAQEIWNAYKDKNAVVM